MKLYFSLITLLIINTFLASCHSDTPSSDGDYTKMLTELASSHTGIDFENTIIETEDNNHLVWESIYNGAGVGIGDLNNDGLLDIYFCGNMTMDKIYLNKGNMKFEDITKSTGIDEQSWSSGVVMADVNKDGLLDIYISKMSWEKDESKVDLRKNKLYINTGNLRFEEVAHKYGIDDAGHTTQSSFFDYNKDGLLDLYVMNAPSHRYDQKLQYMNDNAIPYEFKDHLYVNKGGRFEDVTLEAIGEQEHAYGLGLSTVDINQDGWTDIYVSNDFEKPDLLLINNKNGGFENQLTSRMKHLSYSSMGMDIADINNDAFTDIFVLDMQSGDHVRSKTNMPSMDIRQFWQNVSRGYYFQYMSNMLQLNTGTGKFSEIGQLAGVASTDWSWSVLLADIDNDSYRDIMITNGINRNIKDNDFNIWLEKEKKSNKLSFLELSKKTKVQKIKNFAFQNDKGNLHFTNKSDIWGFNHSGFSYGAAYGDLDNDGDIDMVVNNSNELASIYQNNNLDQNHYVRVKVSKDNRPLLNAKATIYYNGKKQYAEQHNVRGYQSCSEPIIHFGLAQVRSVDSLIVEFGDGSALRMDQLKVDSTYHIEWKNDFPIQKEQKKEDNTYFTSITSNSGLVFQHRENRYNDFLKQVLIPHMETKNGPFISKGDIDGNDRQDIFIGGAKGQSGQFSTQSRTGGLTTHYVPALNEDTDKEDMGSCLFDIDNDKDLDLYIVSGGSEDIEGSALYKDRLYKNDGKGNYTKSDQELPSSNGSIVLAIDIDKDGYKDLFVGGRMEGLKYPYPGLSHILMNNKGKLKEDISFPYQKLGMVTAAKVIDVNQDGWDDIVVVGEWMQPTFLINEEGVLRDRTERWLPKKNVGWWFDIEAEDLDGDGVEEIILGNIGMNNKYHASVENPLKVYSADFDKNNSNDIVLAKQTAYGEVPVRGRQCSSEQLPYIKRKFKSYDAFAHAEVSDILGKPNMKEALVLEANNFRTGYLKLVGMPQDPKAYYEFYPFPNAAQFSAVQGIEILDVNQDSLLDIVMVGNLFDAEVETTRHDASFGTVLLNKGNLKFVALAPYESGLEAGNNAKDMTKIKLGDKTCLLVTNNNFWTQVFQLD